VFLFLSIVTIQQVLFEQLWRFIEKRLHWENANDALSILTQCLSWFHTLIHLAKSLEQRRLLALSMKHGRHFLESFMKRCLPKLTPLFKDRQQAILTLLKILQQATRGLQVLFIHG
jgi:hypothetical protein